MLTKLFDLVGRVDDGIAMKLREAYFARLPANEQLRLLSKIFFLKTVTDQEILMRAVLHDRRGRSAGYKEKLALERIVDQKTLIKIVESLCAETSLDPNLGCIALERIEDETFLICLAFDESARVELRGAAATRISKQEVFIELVSRARVTKGHGDEWLGAKALRGIVDQEFLSSIALDNSVCGSWREIAAERVLKQEVLIELASRAGVDGSQRIRQEKLGAICLKGIVDQEFLSRVALDNSAYDSWRKIATAKLTKQEVLIELVSRAGVDKLERSKHEELGRIALKGIVDQEFLSRVVLDSNASSSWRQIAMDGLNDQEQLCKALSQPTVIPILGTEGLRKIFNQEFLVRIVLDESGYLQWRKIAAEQITDQALLISVVERIHENGSLSGEQKLVGEQVGEIALKKIDNAAFLAKLVSDRSVCGLWRATAVSGIADETLVLALTSEDEVDEVRGEAVRRLVLIGHRDEAYFAEFAKQAGSVAVAALSGVNSEALLV